MLFPNYPNPFGRLQFNPTTTLRFGLPVRSQVQLEIYDLLGQRIRHWPAQFRDAGFHHVIWDGLNDAGMPVASGEYFVRFIAEPGVGGRLVRTARMSVVK
jgi:flagellar hook assembly protein FlgD